MQRPLPKRAGLMPDMTLHRTSAQVKDRQDGFKNAGFKNAATVNCPLPKLALGAFFTGGILGAKGLELTYPYRCSPFGLFDAGLDLSKKQLAQESWPWRP